MTPGALVVLADMASKKEKGKGAAKAAPKVERTVVVLQFADGADSIPLTEYELQLHRQYHKMAESDDPELRARGIALLREAASRSAEASLSRAQKLAATASAARERAAETAPHKALARELASRVSPLVTRQGKKPTARAVKKAAEEIRPATPESSRLASLSVEQIRNLIFGD